MMLRLLMMGMVLAGPVLAQGLPPSMPQPSAEERKQLEAGLARLGKEIDALRIQLKDQPRALRLLPDVEIFHKAVRFPLEYGEICDVAKAKKAIQSGLERAELLKNGKSPWTQLPAVRGYVSRIDGSIQPYLLAVPDAH